MNNKILATIVSLSLLNCNEVETKPESNNFDKIEITNDAPQKPNNPKVKKKIKDTKKEISLCLETDKNSFTHTKTLESVINPENTVLEYPVSQLFQQYWDRPHPLAVKWVKKDFRSLLGRNWIESLKTRIPQKLSHRSENITSDTQYELWDTIRFKLINPLLEWAFPKYLSDQLKEEWFEWFSDRESSIIAEKISNKKNPKDKKEKKSDFDYDIVVKKLSSWRSALALYRDGELFMATYVSIWRNRNKTLTWQFKIGERNPYKRSIKYDNSAMPFALNIYNGRYAHQWVVSWYPLSHWCVRLPGVYADVLFSLVKKINSTDVFISKTLYNTQK